MKIIFLFIIIPFSTFAQNNNHVEIVDILRSFSKVRQNIYNLEYNIQMVDTFSNGSTLSIRGHAVIEKAKQDKDFGYHFSGECFDYSPNHQVIYDGINNFDIDNTKKTYRIVKSVKGYPALELVMRIADMIFFPDDKYINVVISDDTSKYYKIEYQFKDEPPYSNFRKIILLNKRTFIPEEFIMSGQDFAGGYSLTFKLSNVKINKEVSTSIPKIKLKLTSYSMLPAKKDKEEKSLVNSTAQGFLLPKLLDQHMMSNIYSNRLTLLDFWEVWCGHCLESMPKVESLYRKYSKRLDVVGIVTDDTANAKKLIKKLKITFNSLIGNKFVLDKYEVNSWPRYYLINKNGKVIKEYIGFSSLIEKDIKKILKE